jgi:hypothetical protein
MQRVRIRIVNAQRHWRWLQVRKKAREDSLIRYCLTHEFKFLEKATKVASIMGTRQPYQLRAAVEDHYTRHVPLEESSIFLDEHRRGEQ